MAMTVVVTRNVPERVRGFLASCMCEIGPGVYTAPRMDPAVRDRVWDVMIVWCGMRNDLSVVMTWPEAKMPGGQAVRTLGAPAVELIEHNGVFLARRDLTEDDIRSLTTRFGGRLAKNETRDAATAGVKAAETELSPGERPVAIPHDPSAQGESVHVGSDDAVARVSEQLQSPQPLVTPAREHAQSPQPLSALDGSQMDADSRSSSPRAKPPEPAK